MSGQKFEDCDCFRLTITHCVLVMELYSNLPGGWVDGQSEELSPSNLSAVAVVLVLVECES